MRRLAALALLLWTAPALAEEEGARFKDGAVNLTAQEMEHADIMPARVREEGGKLMVPMGAVVWRDGKAWVYGEAGNGRFARREVTIQAVQGDAYEVAGIDKDSTIVTRGAQMLLSEEFSSQLQEGDDD